MSPLTYRPDIDGLRAIAVLFVVLFHADIELFRGGFTGVDVFFVISGFLITSLILKDLQEGRFSLANFWERRVRRILPALFVTIVFTFVMGWLIYMPVDLKGLGYQIAFQSITASNFYFYDTTGYFNAQEEIKPLLHTWSLAVEEQFYIVFPLLFLWLWRRKRAILVRVLSAIAMLSFAVSAVLVFFEPELTFFLLPYRAWELLAGSLLALLMSSGGLPTLQAKSNERLAWAGLCFVITAGVLSYTDIPFPGAAALLPCLGTVLLIWTGAKEGTFVSRLLSHRVPVSIGLVSYSWYLWHWPLLCFAKYILQDKFDRPEKIACIALSFLFAVLSWKYIETPFRRKGGPIEARRTLFIAATLALLSMAAAGTVLILKEGVPSRLTKESLQFQSAASDINPLRKECNRRKPDLIDANDLCQTNPESGQEPSFLLWGDSQADAMVPAFVSLSERYGKNGYIAFQHGCVPILEIHHKNRMGPKAHCVSFNAAVYRFIERNNIKNVYLVAGWTSWLSKEALYFENEEWYGPYKETYENIRLAGWQRTVDELRKKGIRIHILLNNPKFPFDPPRALALEAQAGIPQAESAAVMPTENYLDERKKDVDIFIANNKDVAGITIVDPRPIICPGDFCITAHDGHGLYFDANHYSGYGSRHVGILLEPFFQTLD